MKCKIVTLGSVLFLLASFFTFAQLTPTAPKLYSATARIDVTKRDVQIDCDAPCDHCSLRFSASLATVESLIVSPPRLHEVARRLNLAEKWTKKGKVLSPERVHQILKNSLRTQQYGKTSIIATTAQRPDASEATEIANEVAREFQRYAEEEGVKEKERAKKALEKELQKQKDKTDTAEQQVSELRKKLGLPEKPQIIEDPKTRKLWMKQLHKERISTKVSWLVADAKAKQLANGRMSVP